MCLNTSIMWWNIVEKFFMPQEDEEFFNAEEPNAKATREGEPQSVSAAGEESAEACAAVGDSIVGQCCSRCSCEWTTVLCDIGKRGGSGVGAGCFRRWGEVEGGEGGADGGWRGRRRRGVGVGGGHEGQLADGEAEELGRVEA